MMERRFRSAAMRVAVFLCGMSVGPALANPSIVADLNSGHVLHEEEATRPWYPASLSKLMTAYTVFKAIKAGRVDGGTPVAVSGGLARAGARFTI